MGWVVKRSMVRWSVCGGVVGCLLAVAGCDFGPKPAEFKIVAQADPNKKAEVPAPPAPGRRPPPVGLVNSDYVPPPLENPPQWAEPVSLPDDVAKRIDDVVQRYNVDDGPEVFADMEALFADAREHKWWHSRRAEPILCWLYEIVADVEPESERGYEARLEQLDRWRKAHPESPIPIIAAACANTSWGWMIRGSGFVNTVDEEAWRPFRLKILAARDLLDEAEKLPNLDAYYYALRLRVGRVDGSDREQMEEWLEKGRAIAPDCTPLYSEYAVTLLPRWLGLPGETEDLANRMFEAMPGDAGLMAVASIAAIHIRYDSTAVVQGAYDRERLHAAARYAACRFPESMGMNELASTVSMVMHDQQLALLSRRALYIGKHRPFWWQIPLAQKTLEDICNGKPASCFGDYNLWDYVAAGRVRFLANGNAVVLYNQRGTPLRVLDVESQMKVAELPVNVDDTQAFAKHPTRDQIVFGCVVEGAKSAMVVDFEGEREAKVLYEPALGPFMALVFSPDGETILGGHHKKVSVWRVADSKFLKQFDVESTEQLSLSPDGKHILQAARAIYDAKTGERRLLSSLTKDAERYRWDHIFGFADSQTLVGCATETKSRQPYLLKWDFVADKYDLLTKMEKSAHMGTISADRSLLAVVHQSKAPAKVTVFDLQTGREVKRVEPFYQSIFDLDIAANNSRLAVACSDGSTRVFDLQKEPATEQTSAKVR